MKNLIGSTLLNQFRVETFLAAGGMGSVFKVWDLKRNVYLAMKVLQEDLADDPVVLRRFQREAQTLQKLTHPNIVPFYGLYQDSGYTFLLEAFIDGHTLKDILRAQGGKPLEPAEALGYLQPLTSALGYAHKHKLVHCDLKPGNVMVDHSGVYLTDFGVVRHAEATVTSLGFAGTPAYMAPEQCRGEPVTAATDIYALGIIAYEMLVGRRPFLGNETRGGDTATLKERLRAAQIHARPPDPRRFNPALHENAARALLQALQKDPAQRFHNVQGFYQALQTSLDAAPLPPRVDVTATGGSGVTPPSPPDQERSVGFSGKVTPAVWTAIGVGAAVIVLGAFALFGRGGNRPPAAIPPSSERESSPAASDPLVEAVAPTKTSAPDEPVPTATPRPAATITPTPEPSYSANPNGQIVFTCSPIINQICIINADGSNYRQLTFGNQPSYYASFSPDGQRIIFSSNMNGNYEIYEMDTDGNNIVRLTNNIGDGLYAPAISPDGRTIAFTNERDGTQSIWLMNRNGGNPRPLTDLAAEDVDAVWSPDGTQIAFASYRAGSRQIYIIDANGSNLRQVTNLPNMGGRNSWSPDGEWLAFYAGERSLANREAYIIRTDGTDLVQLTDGGDNLAPCFSNDGQWLVYTSYLDGDMELYLIRPDGSDRRQITHNTYYDWQPRWEP